MIEMPKVGDKVHYAPRHYRAIDFFENGIVKEVREDQKHTCFVVYNCNNEWHRYTDFTSAKTQLSDLFEGWRPDKCRK
jgi:hypothetical protein